MVSKKILDDLKNTLSIAHASLQAQAHGRKQSAKKRVREGSLLRQQPTPLQHGKEALSQKRN
jgi:hypothetical protein